MRWLVRAQIRRAQMQEKQEPKVEELDWSKGICEAHVERRDEIRPAYRLGLCKECFKGKQLEWKVR